MSWWKHPRTRELPALFPPALVDVLARAHAVVEVGGLAGVGPDRGRAFEALFYKLCRGRGISLCEKAGSVTLGHRRAASGFRHEVDAGSRSAELVTHWELKHLSGEVPKNELLIFNGKGLDFLHGTPASSAAVPMRRFLLSGGCVRDDSRRFAILWGIMIIEPGRLALPLLYEAAARDGSHRLTAAERDVIRYQVAWACRPLQAVVTELAEWGTRPGLTVPCGPAVGRRLSEILDVQEQVGADIAAWLDDDFPDWVDDLAEETWNEVGGW